MGIPNTYGVLASLNPHFINQDTEAQQLGLEPDTLAPGHALLGSGCSTVFCLICLGTLRLKFKPIHLPEASPATL